MWLLNVSMFNSWREGKEELYYQEIGPSQGIDEPNQQQASRLSREESQGQAWGGRARKWTSWG